MTKVEREVPVGGLPHLCDESLEEWHGNLTLGFNLTLKNFGKSHLSGYIDKSLVEEKSNLLVEEVGHVGQHLPVAPGSGLLQQKSSETGNRLPTEAD